MLGVLESVRAWQEASEHGWALDTDIALQGRNRLLHLSLVQSADRETRAELSAWEGRPVRWAGQLSAAGHDLLAYARTRPTPAPPAPEPGATPVDLLPSQMAALRVFVGLSDQLRVPVAQGLAERVRTAVHDRGAGRWRLMLTREQMESVAYGFWLHRLTGSAGEANRFNRDYSILYSPAAGTVADPARTSGPEVAQASPESAVTGAIYPG
ncbi:DUF6417 family protein [Streptomyces sp. B21-106]|uniref:DUF6417 family protein n=1 Tax=Streptomyces sp. B21-106 TaxID=3039418 RepID=UPI002FF3F746